MYWVFSLCGRIVRERTTMGETSGTPDDNTCSGTQRCLVMSQAHRVCVRIRSPRRVRRGRRRNRPAWSTPLRSRRVCAPRRGPRAPHNSPRRAPQRTPPNTGRRPSRRGTVRLPRGRDPRFCCYRRLLCSTIFSSTRWLSSSLWELVPDNPFEATQVLEPLGLLLLILTAFT